MTVQSNVNRQARVTLTRNGLHLAFVALFTVMGSIIRDLNLLAILSGLLLGVLLLQWRISRSSIIGMTVTRQIPQGVFAGERFAIRYAIRNSRRLFAAWQLCLEDKLFSQTKGQEAGASRGSLDRLDCQSTTWSKTECVLARRGEYHFRDITLFSEFPFGLTRASANFEAADTLLVYPKLGRLANNWKQLISQQGERQLAIQTGLNEGDFYGIREWQHGDSRRWIHWRTSARIHELAVRQFEHPCLERFVLLVDLQPSVNSQRKSWERVLSFAATVLVDTSKDPRNQICFSTTRGPALNSTLHLDFTGNGLKQLALVDPQEESDLAANIANLYANCESDWPLIIVSSRPRPIEFEERLGREVTHSIDYSWLNLNDRSSHTYFIED